VRELESVDLDVFVDGAVDLSAIFVVGFD